MESLYYGMSVFPLAFIAGVVGALILFNIEDLSKKQIAFLGFIGGPVLWVIGTFLLIGITCFEIIKRILRTKLVKWFWNDILG